MQQKLVVSESYEKNKDRYERGNHWVGVSMWEFEWCPKYRYKMFRKLKYKRLMDACIRRAASTHEIKILELNVQPEHVHCVVGINLNLSPAKALNFLKGISARLFFKNNEKARLRYPKGHLWTAGYFGDGIGNSDCEQTYSYNENEDIHHA